MPLLFESFVTARLRHYLRGYGLRVAAQRPDFLDVDRRIGIRPDVLVFGKGSGAETPLLVLDAKYRRMGQPGREAGGPLAGLNADLYQLGAYMERYRLAAGALVYPRFGHETPTELHLEGTGKRLHLFALDLGASGTGEIESACREMAARVAALCAPHAVATRHAAHAPGVRR
jgi:5-methylcytosine-specific restriction endonuclease McrBC regulatory subunit McrC